MRCEQRCTNRRKNKRCRPWDTYKCTPSSSCAFSDDQIYIIMVIVRRLQLVPRIDSIVHAFLSLIFSKKTKNRKNSKLPQPLQFRGVRELLMLELHWKYWTTFGRYRDRHMEMSSKSNDNVQLSFYSVHLMILVKIGLVRRNKADEERIKWQNESLYSFKWEYIVREIR